MTKAFHNMLNCVRILTITLLIFSLPHNVKAQELNEDFDNVTSFIKTAQRYCYWRPQEKVYLHLDNTGYFKGETIWMKAYVLRTDTGKPTDLSSVLYVELLNPAGDVVEKRKLHIENGVAVGDMKVDSIVSSGFFELRAFTRYMTNWGSNACFSRVIPIFKKNTYEGDWSNPTIDILGYRKRMNNERNTDIDVKNDNLISVNTDEEEKSTKDKPNKRIKFYPEGGDIIAGLPSRVAFLLTNSEGKPLSETCSLLDKKGNVIQQCKTDSHGFGSVNLLKAEEGFYLKDDHGHKQALPKPVDEGCAICFDMMRDNNVVIDFRMSQSLHGQLMGYVIFNNGKIVRCDTITATDHVVREFKRENLPAGVSQFTLYNKEGRIMAERMFFLCPKQDGSERINITSSTPQLKPCGKLTFNIQAQPNANLSFSAVDASGLVNGTNGNMYNWMLLSSELKGYIAHPEYYFEADDIPHRHAADLLMLIQGWRRYDWNLMTGQSTFVKYQPIEDKLYVYGRLRQKTRKGTVDNVWIDMKMFNQEGQVLEGTQKTDSLGFYTFEIPNVYGEWQLHINTGKEDKDGYWEDMNYYVAIDRNFSPDSRYISPLEATAIPIDTTHIFKWNFSEEDERWVNSLDRTRMLKNVTVTAKKRFWDRTNWSNESNAQKFSKQYYDCDEYSERIADEGEEMPSLYDWLVDINSFFSGTSIPTEGYTLSQDTNHIGTAGDEYIMSLDGATHDDNGNPLIYYRGGLGYNNRPIVWIVDNQFFSITKLPLMSRMEVYYSDYVMAQIFPDFLDETKSVYISEDPTLLHNHFFSSDIDAKNPVTVLVYTHRKFTYKQKGIRRTHFQGYNMPSTFKMEDYSDIPPMEDFRRTIYWQPEVKTDGKGKATVQFWNNSIAKDIQISCEGFSPEGVIQVY